MGHITGSKSHLAPLIDRLNRYPIGLVDNEILREILSILFTKEEAYVASCFPLEEATLAEMSAATGIDETELQPILESLANKGIVTDTPYGGETYYFLMPGVIGFFEFTFMKNRSDIPLDKVARLMEDYFHYDGTDGQIGEFFGSKTQLTRSLVYEDHVPVSSEVVSFESAKKIIESASFGSAGMCFCRHKREHEGKTCKKGAPVEEICITLGKGAQFFVRRGFAKEKTKSELIEIIERAQDLNLTHVTDNIRGRPSFICNCCGCCCEIMQGVQTGFYNGVAKTSYIAVIDPDKCSYCGKCFTACNVKAIRPKKDARYGKNGLVSEVRQEVCLGCGACISSCPEGAIKLIPRINYKKPVKTKREMFIRILWEKNRLTPFLISRMKKSFRNLMK